MILVCDSMTLVRAPSRTYFAFGSVNTCYRNMIGLEHTIYRNCVQLLMGPPLEEESKVSHCSAQELWADSMRINTES